MAVFYYIFNIKTLKISVLETQKTEIIGMAQGERKLTPIEKCVFGYKAESYFNDIPEDEFIKMVDDFITVELKAIEPTLRYAVSKGLNPTLEDFVSHEVDAKLESLNAQVSRKTREFMINLIGDNPDEWYDGEGLGNLVVEVLEASKLISEYSCQGYSPEQIKDFIGNEMALSFDVDELDALL